MNYFKATTGIFLLLAVSRFIPHPPNFTSLMALTFYIPALLGVRYLPALLFSFVLTDFFIGFHSIILFTWGSVIFVGLLSRFFIKSSISRVLGASMGACIFFVITNFGVWSTGSYGYTLEGLVTCYFLAIPFFGNSIISVLIYSFVIELIYKFYNKTFKKLV
jgi:hypothetical protein